MPEPLNKKEKRFASTNKVQERMPEASNVCRKNRRWGNAAPLGQTEQS